MSGRIRRRTTRHGGYQIGVGTGPTIIKMPAYLGLAVCNDQTNPGPPYRSGGPLSVNKRIYQVRTAGNHFFASRGSFWYNGEMYVPPYTPSIEPGPLSLTGWGAKGFARTVPVHPIIQLGVSLIELKDAPRLLAQIRGTIAAMAAAAAGKPTTRVAGTVGALLSGSKGGAGGVADQYLGLQFGLMPVLRDLFSLMTLREDLERKIRWLRSHNKKSVRRRVELDSASFSEAVASVGTQSASMGPVLATQLYANPSGPTGFQVTKSVSYRIWFEAKYRYYIPEVAFKDPLTKPFGLAADLAGLSPDPVVIYKVIPWSWLLDWFTSVGSVIQNIMLRHKYHVVAEYAYVMASQDITYEKPGYCVTKSGTYTCTPQGCSFTGPDVVHAGSAKTVYAIRQRAVANPYGFGITWSALTPYQLSILAALGLSKGGKSLP